MLAFDALTALVVGLIVGLHTIDPWVRPSTMHLEPNNCGSVLRPHSFGELVFNAPVPPFQVQSCAAARHESLLLTIGLFVLAAVLLVLAAVARRFERRPMTASAPLGATGRS